MGLLLLNPLEVYIWRNEPIKHRTWDGLLVTTESNFTPLNSMRPLNDCLLQPVRHPSLCINARYVCLRWCPARCFPLSQPRCHSLHCSPLSVSQAVSSLSLSLPFHPFFCLSLTALSPSPHPLMIPLALGCVKMQQSPRYLVLFTVAPSYY